MDTKVFTEHNNIYQMYSYGNLTSFNVKDITEEWTPLL
jgi:hypothetical protein